MEKIRKYLRTSLSFCVLFLMLCMLAFLGSTGPSPVKVAQIPKGGELLLFAEWQDSCLVAFTGEELGTGGVLVLDGTTGSTKAYRSFSQGQALWAGQRGDFLFTVEETDGNPILVQLSLPNLSVLSSQPLPVTPESYDLFDCDGEGRIYYTQNGTLWTSTLQGDSQNLGLSPLFFEITPGGTCVASGDWGVSWGASGNPEAWKQSDASASGPFCLLGESYFLADLFGTIYQLGTEELFMVGTATLPDNPLYCAMDRDGNVLTLNSGQVICSTLDGEQVTSLTLSGNPLAVCGNGALTEDQDAFWFTPLQFYQPSTPTPSPETTPTPEPSPSVTPTPTPTPTPEPTPSPGPSPSLSPSPSPEVSPSPSPSPSSSPSEEVVIEGDTLLVHAGMTASQLRTYFVPDAIEICRPDGTAITEGRLCTGMTADSYTVVVLGDCDGSGNVTSSDLRQSQTLLLESTSVDSPYRRAADLNGDHLITTEDLVLLNQWISD